MESDNKVFALPAYLLKTPYGDSLQQQLVQPTPSKQELSQTTRLSTTGVLGSLPSRFNDPRYHDDVMSMLSHSPHITNTASRRSLATADLDNDSTMMDSSRRIGEDFDGDDEHGPLGSIHYASNILDDEDVEQDEEALESDHDDVGIDIDSSPGPELGLRRMRGSSRRVSSVSFRDSASAPQSRATTAVSEPMVMSGFKYPLPLKWESTQSSQLTIVDSGLTLKVDQTRATASNASISKNYDYHCARGDSSIPVHVGVFYYETKINAVTNNNNKGLCDVVIGFNYSTLTGVPKMPGLEVGSYGLNGRDGTTMANQTISRRYSREFGLGDVIGCGVNFATKVVFYTKNGVYLGIAFKDITKALVPSIGLKSGNSVTTNFGMEPFRFDIEGYIEQEKLKISETVLNHTTTGYATSSGSVPCGNDMEMRVNTNTDKEIPGLMQSLVSSYFDHLGYVDIAKTFAEEVKREQFPTSAGSGSQEADGDAKMHDDDETSTTSIEETNLKTRERIRNYLLNGDVDGAIKLTNAHFPSVFEEHGEILFKLSCNKFVQLIKGSKIDEAVVYGQSLREQYSENEKHLEFLNDIFSLLAYEDPEVESEFGHLLKDDEILKISDELNAEILKSLGKSSVSDLERLMRHAKAMLKIMNSDKAQLDTLLMTNDEFGL